MSKKYTITLKEQLTVCEEALKILKESSQRGLCYCLSTAIINLYDNDSKQLKAYTNTWEFDFIPTLQRKKPNGLKTFDYWWSLDNKGHKKRIDVLKQTISEIQKRIK